MLVAAEHTTPWLKSIARRIPKVGPEPRTVAPSVLTAIAVVIIWALPRTRSDNDKMYRELIPCIIYRTNQCNLRDA